MWTKKFRLVWLRIETEKNKKFIFSMPLSLCVFTELLECLADLLAVLGLFFRKKKIGSIPIPIGKEMLCFAIELLETLSIGESYHLVDIAVHKVKVAIEVK